MNTSPRITFFYTDGVERQTLQSLAEEAQARGYETVFSSDPGEAAEVAVACYHSGYPRPQAALSVIMLHDIAQGHLNWPDFWRNERWDKYDIGILPGPSWTKRWQQCSWRSYCNPRLGVYEAGWPKADVVFRNRDLFRLEAAKLRKQLGLKHERTVIYTPSWENHGKQIDFVEKLKDLPVNLVVKQAAWSVKNYPHIVKEVNRLAVLHTNYADNVYVGDPEINIMYYLGLADIVVSDESSIMVEALLFNIPSVAVMDWLVPDINPPRNPGVPFDFVYKTTREGLHNTTAEILQGLEAARARLHDFQESHFSHLGQSATTVMDILDHHIKNKAKRVLPIIPAAKPALADFSFDRGSGCFCHPRYETKVNAGENADPVLAALMSAKDRSTGSVELKSKIRDAALEFAFSPVRSNLLRPFPLAGKRVLEIGAGSGALARYMGEAGATVDALESDFTLARCAAVRCADLANVRVYRTFPLDFAPTAEYDYVLLCGSLEAGPRLFENYDPASACLEQAKACLGPGGVVILATDNRMSLASLLGATDEITGQPFWGLRDFYSSKTGRNMGRDELVLQVQQAGLHLREILYPFPDFRFPEVFLTEAGICEPSFSTSALLQTLRGKGKKENPLDHLIWAQIEANGLLPGLANSFVFVAAKEACPAALDGRLAIAYCSHRVPEHNHVREFIKSGDEIRIATSAQTGSTDTRTQVTRHFGENLGSLFIKTVFRHDGLKLEMLLNAWYRFVLGNGIEEGQSGGPDSVIKMSFVDCLPDNLFLSGGSLVYLPISETPICSCTLEVLLLRGFFHLQTRIGGDEFILNGNSSLHKLMRKWLTGLGIRIGDELLQRLVNLEMRILKARNGPNNYMGVTPAHLQCLQSYIQYLEQNAIGREQGKLYYERGMLSQALQEFSGIFKRNPNDIEALLYLAKISVSTARFEEAAGFFEAVLEEDPDCSEAVEGRAAVAEAMAGLSSPQP